MKTKIIIALMSFILGLIFGISLFYNEEWENYRSHLEWSEKLRTWDYIEEKYVPTEPRQECLYWWIPTGDSSATGKEIFCVPIKETSKIE